MASYLVGPSEFTNGISIPTGTEQHYDCIASRRRSGQWFDCHRQGRHGYDFTCKWSVDHYDEWNGHDGLSCSGNGSDHAVKIPVTPDTTLITALATDQTGTQHQASVNITVTPQSDDVALTASPGVGIPMPKQTGSATFDSILSTSASLTNVASYAWDFAGTGALRHMRKPCERKSECNEQPGLYLSQTVVNDNAENSFKGMAIVNVIDYTAMNALLTQKWNGMTSKLASGDISGALTHFIESSRDVQRAVYSAGTLSVTNYGSYGDIQVSENDRW